MRVIFALVAALFSSQAFAQDAGWSVLRDTVSQVDGKRTFSVFAKRGDVVVSVGCDISGPMVSVFFDRDVVDVSTPHRGAYRAGGSSPVHVTWDGGDTKGGTLFNGEARDAIEALLPAPIWHVRIGHEERSIDMHGLAPYAERIRAACLRGQ